MSDKTGEVVILAEKLGLPADAAGSAIVSRVYELAEKAAESDKWRAKAENLLARVESGENAKKELAAMSGKMLIERAISNQWIDKAEEAFYLGVFKLDPKLCEKQLDERKYRSFLSRELALDGNVVEAKSALEQIDAMAHALMEKNGKLTLSEARAEVQTKNPDLSEKYRSEIVKGVGGAN